MNATAHDQDLPLAPDVDAEVDELGEPVDPADVDEEVGADAPPDGDEPVDVVAPPDVDNERTLDEQADKLGKAAKSYTNKVIAILGDDLSSWIPCELCAPYVPGLRLPVEVDDATKEALRVLIGLPGMANYQQDRFSTTCNDCGGLGRVKTGSVVANQSTVQCLPCKGRGWIPIGNERASDAPPSPVYELAVVDAEVPVPVAAMPPAALAALRATVEAAEAAAAAAA